MHAALQGQATPQHATKRLTSPYPKSEVTMTNPRDNSKAIGGRRSSRRRRSQTSLNLRNAFRSDQSTISGSSSPTSVRTATSSSSSSLHGAGDAATQGTVQVDGRDGRLTRTEMLDILQAAIDMSNEALVPLSASGRSGSDTSDDNEEESGDSPMQ